MLWAAVRRGRLDFARYLIKTGDKLRTRPESEGERLLLEGGARINAEATRIAAERGNEEVLKLFLDHCAARTSGHEQLTDVSDDDDDHNPLEIYSDFDSDGEPYQRRKYRYWPDPVRLVIGAASRACSGSCWTGTRAYCAIAGAGRPDGVDLNWTGGDALDKGRPLYNTESPGPCLARHLISLGAQTTEDKYRDRKEGEGKKYFIQGVHVTERTWEWVSKY
ncbi:hypothetical protein PG995_014460 [Apiospora arundinis]